MRRSGDSGVLDLLGCFTRLVFRKGFIAPPPPGVVALDAEQELRHWPSAGCQEAYGLTDAAVGGVPRLGVLVEELELPELVVEQRLDFREPGRRPDLGAEPGKVPAVTTSSARSSSPRTSCHEDPASFTGRSCHLLRQRRASARETAGRHSVSRTGRLARAAKASAPDRRFSAHEDPLVVVHPASTDHLVRCARLRVRAEVAGHRQDGRGAVCGTVGFHMQGQMY
jgi:hypothetical protein